MLFCSSGGVLHIGACCVSLGQLFSELRSVLWIDCTLRQDVVFKDVASKFIAFLGVGSLHKCVKFHWNQRNSSCVISKNVRNFLRMRSFVQVFGLSLRTSFWGTSVIGTSKWLAHFWKASDRGTKWFLFRVSILIRTEVMAQNVF